MSIIPHKHAPMKHMELPDSLDADPLGESPVKTQRRGCSDTLLFQTQ